MERHNTTWKVQHLEMPYNTNQNYHSGNLQQYSDSPNTQQSAKEMQAYPRVTNHWTSHCRFGYSWTSISIFIGIFCWLQGHDGPNLCGIGIRQRLENAQAWFISNQKSNISLNQSNNYEAHQSSQSITIIQPVKEVC